MKKALVQGTRICQIEDVEFPVHPDLKWIEVPDDTTARDTWNGESVMKELPPIMPKSDPVAVFLNDLRQNPAKLARLQNMVEDMTKQVTPMR